MKLLLAALLFAGCAKANDIGRLEDECVEIAKSYAPTATELSHRADELRKEKLGPEAESRLRDANAEIQSLKAAISIGSNREMLEREAKGDPNLVQKKIDNTEANIEARILSATDHLGAVESWLQANSRTAVAAQ